MHTPLTPPMMPVDDAIAANVRLGEPVSLEVLLLDSSVFLENACWFKLLQDEGKQMTLDKIS